MDAKIFNCDLCGHSFPHQAQGASLTDKELYVARWIPLGGKIFCEVCAVKALAKAVDIIIDRPKSDNP
jgi:hypothetical protein